MLQSLTFNTSWKELRVENRNEALCALGKTGRTGYSGSCFQEKILWAQILGSSHIWKSTKIINRNIFSLWLAVGLCQNVRLTEHIPLHSNHREYWLPLSPGEGNGNPLQYSCLENPMDREDWRVIVHGITKSQTQLSNTTHFTRPSLSRVDSSSELSETLSWAIVSLDKT